MKKTITKIFAAMCLAVLAAALFAAVPVKAETAYFHALPEKDLTVEAVPGEKVHVHLKLASKKSFYCTGAYGVPDSGAPFTCGPVSFSNSAATTTEENNALNIYSGNNVYIDFDIDVQDCAKIGYYGLSIRAFSYENGSGTGSEDEVLRFSIHVPTELLGPQLVVRDVIFDTKLAVPGSKLDLAFDIVNQGQMTAKGVTYEIVYEGTGLGAVDIEDAASVKDLTPGDKVSVILPVKVLSEATPGLKTVSIKLKCKTLDGKESFDFTRKISLMVATGTNYSQSSNIVVRPASNHMTVVPGEKVTVDCVIENIGERPAKSVFLKMSGLGTSVGLTPGFSGSGISIGNIKGGKSVSAQISFVVENNFAASLQEIGVYTECIDADGFSLTSAVVPIYLNAPSDSSSVLDITNVSQSEEEPVAGQNVTISFDVKNSSGQDIKNLRFWGLNLSSAGFEPTKGDPYIPCGELAAGKTKKLSLTFKIGKSIPEGLNSLGLGYSFENASGKTETGSTSVYVLNITNSSLIGKPKIIVNSYETDIENIKAGNTFTLKYQLKNTHASKDAKNVKITVSQKDGAIAASKGTNISYLDRIEPGEIIDCEIELRAKPGTLTADYSLDIAVEYEYDDMSEEDEKKGGVSDSNDIKIRITENYRPEIENIYLDDWQGVYVGESVPLSFEFYNMGASQLGNVFVTVEGDFVLSNNSSMSYIGAVPAYGQDYIDISVDPLIEGEAMGTVTIHFEDSNGDEQTASQEFTTYVSSRDGDFGDFGDFGEFDDFGDMGMDGEEKAGLPVWAIILIVVAAAVIIAVVVIVVLKKKKKKAEELEDMED